MKVWSSKEILEKYLNFYKEKEHKQVPNVPVIPQEDSTLLYVNSGMFPLVPYLSGQPHPLGKRLVNVQRCLRFFEDIDNVGETLRHTTAFHMIGNWSLNDYFKKQQLKWKYEFFIEYLGLDPQKIYSTVYKGDESVEKDTESIKILQDIFKKYGIEATENEKIFALGKDNWWQRGEAIGELGGPSSEIFYYIGKEGNGLGKHVEKNEDEFIEIGNSVFMYYKKTEKGWEEIEQKNVDYGGGLERIAMVVQGKNDIYETDNFYSIIQKIEDLSGKKYSEYKKEMRVLADHMRSSVVMAMDEIKPSNKDQGYILRRLLRRMVRYGNNLGIKKEVSTELVEEVVNLPLFKYLYPELKEKQKKIESIFSKEEKKFKGTLERAEKEVSTLVSKIKDQRSNYKSGEIAKEAFDLYQSHGYPVEMFIEDLEDGKINFNKEKFIEQYERALNDHQELSRKGAEQKFKGGLADSSEEVIKYHTTTHLLQKSLKEVLGEKVKQQGSNNTKERLRFDFNFERALKEEEIKKIEDKVNKKIKEGLPVKKEEMPKEEALKTGAYHLEGVNYPEKVFVYYIGKDLQNAWSKEFCGGPHVKNTSELGTFKIIKEESASKGIRRIRAILK